MRLFQTIADFVYLSWHLLPFAPYFQEALEQESAEMRRQTDELRAEAARTGKGDKDAGRSGRSRATPFRDLCFALTVFAVDEYWRITAAYHGPRAPLGYGNKTNPLFGHNENQYLMTQEVLAKTAVLHDRFAAQQRRSVQRSVRYQIFRMICTPQGPDCANQFGPSRQEADCSE